MCYYFQFSLSFCNPFSLLQFLTNTHRGEADNDNAQSHPQIVRWGFSVEFLLLLLIPGHRGSRVSSPITEGCIETVCKKQHVEVWHTQFTMWLCNSCCFCFYSDSLITQFRQSHKCNIAVGEKLELFYYNQVPNNWAYLTMQWGSYERALFHVFIKTKTMTLLHLTSGKEFRKWTFASIDHFL